MRFIPLILIAMLAACSDESASNSPPTGSSGATALNHDPFLEELNQAVSQSINLNQHDGDGKTFLIRSIEKKHVEGVKFLLENGADANGPNKKGGTPIVFAVVSNHPGMLDLLKAHGASLVVPPYPGAEGVTLLHLATKRNAGVSVRWLIEHGADVNAKDPNGETPVHHWVGGLKHDITILDDLVKAGADLTVTTKRGLTPVDIAIGRGELDVARGLVDRGGTTSAGQPTIEQAWPREPDDPPHDVPFLQRRSTLNTRLIRKGPAPADTPGDAPPGVETIMYRSGALDLKAWLVRPDAPQGKSPVMIYLHGGFAADEFDVNVCKPFVAAGFMVLIPMLRGENGNPGDFELMCGEVEDAIAAVQWIAKQPFIDAERIFAFGHSVGGGLAELMTLWKDVPLRHSASCGGLYTPMSLILWRADNLIPFDYRYFEEYELRCLLPHVSQMQRNHIAYMGDNDRFDGRAYLKHLEGKDSKLEIRSVPGDHETSLPHAINAYLAELKKTHAIP